jgi:membrane-associated protease RseP (regulator of RpoE activity)
LITRQDLEIIRKVVSKHYRITEPDEVSYPVSYRIKDLDVLPESMFRGLLDDLEKYGFVAFTDEADENKIYIIRGSEGENRELIRLLLFFLTILSVLYAGYHYSSLYFSNSPSFILFAYSSLLFFVPIYCILMSREFARYIITRKHNLEYSFPIFIPDPIFFGCLGSIPVVRQGFRDRETMMETGLYPLITGFLVSIAIVMIGTLSSLTPVLNAPSNFPTSSWGFPVILSPAIAMVSGSYGVLNPIQFAGWSGIIMSGFNALPLGYLDGGLVWKGLAGRKTLMARYPVMISLIVLGLFFPEFVILPLVVLVLGLRGPEPLIISSPSKFGRLAVLAICGIILAGGLIPFHYSPPSNKFSAYALEPVSIVYLNSDRNASFDLMVENLGTSSIQPYFTILNLQNGINVSGPPGSLTPQGNGLYAVQFRPPQESTVGITNYTLAVSSGINTENLGVSVLTINLSNDYLLDGKNGPLKMESATSTDFNFTLSANYSGSRNLSLFIIPEVYSNYSVLISNMSLRIPSGTLGSVYPYSDSFQLAGRKTISLDIKVSGGQNEIDIFFVDMHYQGAASYVTFKL